MKELLKKILSSGVTERMREVRNRALHWYVLKRYGDPTKHLKLIGVTGTNGKTTTVTLLYEMFRAAGHKVGLISTVKYVVDSRELPSVNTTPGVLGLNRLLARMVKAGCEYCFMEVSSHSVVQQRIYGLTFAGGVFTNITHDHLDFHKTFANYIKAKQGFFTLLPKEAFALTNIDDRNGRIMVQNSKAHCYTYAMRSPADFHVRILETSLEGMLLELDGEQVWVQPVGEFNAYNLTTVYGAVRLMGMEKSEALRLLSTMKSVRGRFETVRTAAGTTAIIDYAHSPDALENVMDTINVLRNGRGKVYVVVGCGGDRDRTKRPEMARIAVERSDLAIFTSDNPRTENPQTILDEMLMGVATMPRDRYITISDRREAIRTAMRMATPGDVVLVAGKGHETYQIIGREKRHFDDREEVMNC